MKISNNFKMKCIMLEKEIKQTKHLLLNFDDLNY